MRGGRRQIRMNAGVRFFQDAVLFRQCMRVVDQTRRRPQPRLQRGNLAPLAQKIIRPRRKRIAADPVLFAACHQNDVDIMIQSHLAHASGQLDPVHLRHAVIGDQNLRTGLGKQLQCVVTVLGLERAVAQLFDHAQQIGPLDQVVVGDDHIKGIIHALRPSAKTPSSAPCPASGRRQNPGQRNKQKVRGISISTGLVYPNVRGLRCEVLGKT